MTALLQISEVTKNFGGFTALDRVSVEIAKGERFGLVGPNGSGKTTLINCVSGVLANDGGSIRFAGREISGLPTYQRTRLGIARSFQIPRPFASMSVLENLLVPLEYVSNGKIEEAHDILRQIGLADKAATRSNQLSQVELRKLELARAMADQRNAVIPEREQPVDQSAHPGPVGRRPHQVAGFGQEIVAHLDIRHVAEHDAMRMQRALRIARGA